ncbi:hypothetical protein P7K49_003850, partial [Saguinus oedipus]
MLALCLLFLASRRLVYPALFLINLHFKEPTDRSHRTEPMASAAQAQQGVAARCQTVTCWVTRKEKGLSPSTPQSNKPEP